MPSHLSLDMPWPHWQDLIPTFPWALGLWLRWISIQMGNIMPRQCILSKSPQAHSDLPSRWCDHPLWMNGHLVLTPGDMALACDFWFAMRNFCGVAGVPDAWYIQASYITSHKSKSESKSLSLSHPSQELRVRVEQHYSLTWFNGVIATLCSNLSDI